MILDDNLDMRLRKSKDELVERNTKAIENIVYDFYNSDNKEVALLKIIDDFIIIPYKKPLTKREEEMRELYLDNFYNNLFPFFKNYFKLVKKAHLSVDENISKKKSLYQSWAFDIINLVGVYINYVFNDFRFNNQDLTPEEVDKIIENKMTAERRNKNIEDLLS